MLNLLESSSSESPVQELQIQTFDIEAKPKPKDIYTADLLQIPAPSNETSPCNDNDPTIKDLMQGRSIGNS